MATVPKSAISVLGSTGTHLALPLRHISCYVQSHLVATEGETSMGKKSSKKKSDKKKDKKDKKKGKKK